MLIDNCTFVQCVLVISYPLLSNLDKLILDKVIILINICTFVQRVLVIPYPPLSVLDKLINDKVIILSDKCTFLQCVLVIYINGIATRLLLIFGAAYFSTFYYSKCNLV